MLIALDSETTGLDLYHDARPFFVTICREDGELLHWEWPVDPFTRMPCIPPEAVDEIRAEIEAATRIVGQNLKFDVTALEQIGICDFPWGKVDDTLVSGHMLYTSRPHTLDKMVLQYLDEDINPVESDLREAVEECRRLCRSKKFREVYGDWAIAERGRAGMPSAKDKNWEADMWLPLAVAMECEYPPEHPYYTVTERYANTDSEWTLALWRVMEREIGYRGLEAIYRARMEVIPVAQAMERGGVTVSGERTRELTERFGERRQHHINRCVEIAAQFHYDLDVPKSGNNDSLTGFVFDVLNLPAIKTSGKTGAPSLDKECIDEYALTLEPGPALDFITELKDKRKLDTALQYIEGYERFWIPLDRWNERGERLWYLLHPNLNPTGTVQLRWSSSNPNAQNISKQEGYNLRYCFGPTPDREWWSLDAQNIELRIPTFEAGEPDLMSVFLKPKEPPYFGSYHLVVFDLLHPEKFKEHGKDSKDVFESTWYQWVKNGNFAMIYGCQRKKADATYKVAGAYDLVRYRFPKIAQLADRQMELARRRGYVETIPDRTVDPKRGFPIMASRTEDGGVLPTTPLNYHVSGTAMWWTQKGMVRCHRRLEEWARGPKKFDGRICLQVHDEMVFDLPRSRVDPREDLDNEKRFGGPCVTLGGEIDLRAYKSNLGRVRILQREMEKGGDDIGLPTPVGVELNADNWAEITLKC